MYDYAATATSQISLAANDRVAVLSKCGADKGWWKGEHCSTRKVVVFTLNRFDTYFDPCVVP
ncbi:hypothetical protein DPMN_016156 [Dreissena polymorpha]|uniref:SH3 domain-containing protein n=1 Tax=Dreissena polymorpha TaxID=45954 RepID=A0A9D4NE06_DREPO|nr:hypothetical protein DPMN_016156 [Dreissena polymorpha]